MVCHVEDDNPDVTHFGVPSDCVAWVYRNGTEDPWTDVREQLLDIGFGAALGLPVRCSAGSEATEGSTVMAWSRTSHRASAGAFDFGDFPGTAVCSAAERHAVPASVWTTRSGINTNDIKASR